MKLTLIHPCVGKIPGKEYIRSWQMEPLLQAYLAALAPEDVEVAFWDDRVEDIPFDLETDLVAISVETYTAKRAYQIASEFRKRGKTIVMGGFHATLVPEEVLRYADAIVIGEAEECFPWAIRDFRAGKLQRIYRNIGRPRLDLLMPDRRIFEGKPYLKLGLIEASRGCHFRCDFCAIAASYEGSHRHRPLSFLVREIAELKNKKPLFFFVDDNIVSDVKFAKELCRALIPLNVKWVGQASITLSHDEELLALLKESGCQGVLIGFESLNTDNLALMNKNFNASRGGFVKALERLNEYGIRLYATFVFGYDHDTVEDFRKTVDFCVRHQIFMAAFNHLTPFPGTPLYKKLAKEGRLLSEAWWLSEEYRYGQVPFKSLIPPEILEEECVKARKLFYGLPSIWKRMWSLTNSGNFLMWRAFCFINLLLRKEASQRIRYPLGDLRFTEDLLPSEHVSKEAVPA